MQCGSENISPFFAIEQEARSPDEYWHTIIALCSSCKKGQLERTYYDASDVEDIISETELFILDESSMARLREYVEQRNFERTTGKSRSGCPAPLSPHCTCGVHCMLSEASKRIDPLTDTELQELNGRVSIVFLFTREGYPMFMRSF